MGFLFRKKANPRGVCSFISDLGDNKCMFYKTGDTFDFKEEAWKTISQRLCDEIKKLQTMKAFGIK